MWFCVVPAAVPGQELTIDGRDLPPRKSEGHTGIMCRPEKGKFHDVTIGSTTRLHRIVSGAGHRACCRIHPQTRRLLLDPIFATRLLRQ